MVAFEGKLLSPACVSSSRRHARTAAELTRTKSPSVARRGPRFRRVLHEPCETGDEVGRGADRWNPHIAGHAGAFGEVAILHVELDQGFRMLGDEGDGDDDDADAIV